VAHVYIEKNCVLCEWPFKLLFTEPLNTLTSQYTYAYRMAHLERLHLGFA